MKLFLVAFISCEPMYICKRLIAFSYMEALLQRLDICSWNLNWLTVVIPSSFTDLLVSVILLSVFNELVQLFLSCFCKIIASNLSGLTIILFSLNYFVASSNSLFEIIKRSSVLFDSTEIVLPSAKLYSSDFLML